MSGALSGITVLDLTRLFPGPFCTGLLADFGANVIKVEDTRGGDYLRWLPPLSGEEGAAFSVLNRNKKSMRLNLQDDRGREIFLKLARQADVVVESFRPGVVRNLGIAYEDLKAIHEAIIYCSISGYGQEGHYKNRAGHDLNYIALAGLLGITGTSDSRPVIPGVQIADFAAGGLQAACAVLMALYDRTKSGKGQYIDISMRDCTLALLGVHVAEALASGVVPEPGRMLLSGRYICYNVYRTGDGRYMSLGALEPKFWKGFCMAIEREDLIPHQFAEGEERNRYFNEIEKIFLQKTQAEWVAFFKPHDVCCEPVLNLIEAVNMPAFAHRQMLLKDNTPSDTPAHQMGIAIKMTESPGACHSPSPGYGAHTSEILRSIGIDEETQRQLEEAGVV